MFINPLQGIRASDQRQINKTALLNTLLTKRNMTRVELARSLSISEPTVSRIVADLIKDGMLVESNYRQKNMAGRKAIVLTLNPQYSRAFAIKVGVRQTILTVVNFSQEIEKSISFQTEKDPSKFMETLVENMKALLLKIGVRTGINSVVVSIPGIVDSSLKRIIATPNIGWTNFDFSEKLKSEMSERLGLDLPVLIDNEANLAIIAESVMGERIRDEENVIYVLVGEGIGTGLILNRQLYRGKWNTAGEFGHMVIETDGRECHCGNRGCWEKYASLSTDVGERIMKSEKISRSELEEYARFLGVGVSNMINGISPELVIIGGPVMSVWERMKESLMDIVHESVITEDLWKVRLERSSFTDFPAELYGAAILAFWNVFKGPVLA